MKTIWDASSRHELQARFGAIRPMREFANHPAFGRLSGRTWGALM